MGLSPTNVEARLARHAVLYKLEDCECCPHPLWSDYLTKAKEEGERKKEEGKGKGKLKLEGRHRDRKDKVAAKKQVKKEEDEEVMISVATPKRRREVAKEENKDIKPRKPTRNVSKADEEEDEV